jgi:hypothetical protein
VIKEYVIMERCLTCLQNFLELETREKKKQKHIPLKNKGQRRLHEFLEFQSLEKIMNTHNWVSWRFAGFLLSLLIPTWIQWWKPQAQRKKERIMHPGASLDIASIQWNYENSKNWILKICLPSLVETAWALAKSSVQFCLNYGTWSSCHI